MMIEQLMGRYLRLKQDLEIAYKAQPWHTARINRLANDIARTELELASHHRPPYSGSIAHPSARQVG